MRQLTNRIISVLILLCGTAGVSYANTCTYQRVSVKDVCGQVVAWPTREPIPDAEVTVLTTAGVAVKDGHVDQNGDIQDRSDPQG